MLLGLLQTKQNKLYDFENGVDLPQREREALAKDMVRNVLEMAAEAAKKGCDYIVTPEAVNFMGLPRTEEELCLVEAFGGESYGKFSELAGKYSVNIIVGLYNMRGGNAYNSAIMINRKGRLERVYDKVNLAGDENIMLTAGKEYCVVQTEFGKIAPLVCWDMQCGAAAAVAEMGADLICCPTWGWENRYGIGCAKDNGVYVGAAMGIPYSGDIAGERTPSEILDRNGNVLSVGDRSTEGIIMGEIIL